MDSVLECDQEKTKLLRREKELDGGGRADESGSPPDHTEELTELYHRLLQAILWLEGYLQTWSTTLLLVSHDRTFLSSVCTDIVQSLLGVHVNDISAN